MKYFFTTGIVLFLSPAKAQNNLPVYNTAVEKNNPSDWLVTAAKEKATAYTSSDRKI